LTDFYFLSDFYEYISHNTGDFSTNPGLIRRYQSSRQNDGAIDRYALHWRRLNIDGSLCAAPAAAITAALTSLRRTLLRARIQG
jgi:hypothetical protein